MVDGLRGKLARTTAQADREGSDRIRVALGVARERNAELLRGLLSEYEVVEATEEVPTGTDLCIVDQRGFADLRESLAAWKRDQRPATAPVLLVANGNTDELWSRYADAMGEALDAIQNIPAPRRAVRSRVEGLVRARRDSLLATERRARLELYEHALDGTEFGITIADASEDTPLHYVNDGFLEMTGYEREEVLGRNCRFLQGEETDPETVARIRDAIDQKRPVSVEIRNYRASGEPFWNRLEVVPVREDGEVTHFIGFQRDVTERKDRETLLEEYERVVQSVNDPILVLDSSGTVRYMNDAAERSFGGGDDTAIETLFEPTVAVALREIVSEVRMLDEELTRELTIGGSGRQRSTYQFRLQPVSFEGETRIIVVARDITEIRRQQERLSVLDRVLRHNLRNKLNVVTGHAQTLADSTDRSSEDIETTAERIETAAETLLELSEAARRFDVGTDPNEGRSSTVDLVEFVESVVPELRDTHPTAEIRTRLPEDATAVCPSQLRFCLEELVDSAVARGAGTPRVTVAVEARRDCVELRVADDGDPLPDVEQRALAAGAETPLEHTQGIALWLVRWAVEGVNGRFEVSTDDGTTVTLTFPRG